MYFFDYLLLAACFAAPVGAIVKSRKKQGEAPPRSAIVGILLCAALGIAYAAVLMWFGYFY